MAAIQTIGSDPHAAIARRFKTSPQRVRGSGRYALIFKCWHPWKVNLYHTIEERNAAWERSQNSFCGVAYCNPLDHCKGHLIGEENG